MSYKYIDNIPRQKKNFKWLLNEANRKEELKTGEARTEIIILARRRSCIWLSRSQEQ